MSREKPIKKPLSRVSRTEPQPSENRSERDVTPQERGAPRAKPLRKPPQKPISEKDKEKRNASAATCLKLAMAAKTPKERVTFAKDGLSSVRDREMQALLLRQLYLGELELGHFSVARTVAEQLIELSSMPDVARHDAARACQAAGDFDAAVAHLREAVTLGAETRKLFHLSTLASLLYVQGLWGEAESVLQEAIEFAIPGDNLLPLLRAQLALARYAMRLPNVDLDGPYHILLKAPVAEGYGRFVLGELAFLRNDRTMAKAHLDVFLAKTKAARPAAQAALAPEIAKASATLGRMTWN